MTATPDLWRLAELAAGLSLHQHLCLIYETQEQQLSAAVPYLKAGLERREKCLYVANQNSAATVLDALRKSETDVDGYVQSGAMILTSKQETYLKHGPFDPDSMIHFLFQMIQEASNGNFSGLRILGEMTWTLGEDTAPKELIEFEAKLNEFVRDHEVRVLCQYNRNCFPPELVLGVIRTHPVVAHGNIISKNPYYVPPDEFLKPDQASREVERLLNNILKGQRSLDQLHALAARLLATQEAERKHLARELHDEIGQVLTGLRLLLKLNPDSEADELKIRLEHARTIVDDLLARVQGLSFDLRPADLDHLGLFPALRTLFERYRAQTGILVDFKHQGIERRFAPQVETVAYRIVQEALTNAARHAGVAGVTVSVWADADRLTLKIEDRGRGFNPEVALRAPASSGLVGMQERAMLVGGRVKVESVPGTGSTITAELPLEGSTDA